MASTGGPGPTPTPVADAGHPLALLGIGQGDALQGGIDWDTFLAYTAARRKAIVHDLTSLLLSPRDEDGLSVNTPAQVRAVMKFLGNVLALPIDEHELISKTMDVYHQWLFETSQAPEPLHNNEEFWADILEQLAVIFEPRVSSSGGAIKSSLQDVQVTLGQRAISIYLLLARRNTVPGLSLQPSRWARLLRTALKITDKVLKGHDTERDKVLVTKLGPSMIEAVIELFLRSKQRTDELWMRFREGFADWRERKLVVVQWGHFIMGLCYRLGSLVASSSSDAESHTSTGTPHVGSVQPKATLGSTVLAIERESDGTTISLDVSDDDALYLWGQAMALPGDLETIQNPTAYSMFMSYLDNISEMLFLSPAAGEPVGSASRLYIIGPFLFRAINNFKNRKLDEGKARAYRTLFTIFSQCHDSECNPQHLALLYRGIESGLARMNSVTAEILLLTKRMNFFSLQLKGAYILVPVYFQAIQWALLGNNKGPETEPTTPKEKERDRDKDKEKDKDKDHGHAVPDFKEVQNACAKLLGHFLCLPGKLWETPSFCSLFSFLPSFLLDLISNDHLSQSIGATLLWSAYMFMLDTLKVPQCIDFPSKLVSALLKRLTSSVASLQAQVLTCVTSVRILSHIANMHDVLSPIIQPVTEAHVVTSLCAFIDQCLLEYREGDLNEEIFFASVQCILDWILGNEKNSWILHHPDCLRKVLDTLELASKASIHVSPAPPPPPSKEKDKDKDKDKGHGILERKVSKFVRPSTGVKEMAEWALFRLHLFIDAKYGWNVTTCHRSHSLLESDVLPPPAPLSPPPPELLPVGGAHMRSESRTSSWDPNILPRLDANMVTYFANDKTITSILTAPSNNSNSSNSDPIPESSPGHTLIMRTLAGRHGWTCTPHSDTPPQPQLGDHPPSLGKVAAAGTALVVEECNPSLIEALNKSLQPKWAAKTAALLDVATSFDEKYYHPSNVKKNLMRTMSSSIAAADTETLTVLAGGRGGDHQEQPDPPPHRLLCSPHLTSKSSSQANKHACSVRQMLAQFGLLAPKSISESHFLEEHFLSEDMDISALSLLMSKLDSSGERSCHQASVLYIPRAGGPMINEDDIFDINDPDHVSDDFNEFLASLAGNVSLSAHRGFSGALGVSKQPDERALYYCDYSLEIIFAVSTYMASARQKNASLLSVPTPTTLSPPDSPMLREQLRTGHRLSLSRQRSKRVLNSVRRRMTTQVFRDMQKETGVSIGDMLAANQGVDPEEVLERASRSGTVIHRGPSARLSANAIFGLPLGTPPHLASMAGLEAGHRYTSSDSTLASNVGKIRADTIVVHRPWGPEDPVVRTSSQPRLVLPDPVVRPSPGPQTLERVVTPPPLPKHKSSSQLNISKSPGMERRNPPPVLTPLMVPVTPTPTPETEADQTARKMEKIEKFYFEKFGAASPLLGLSRQYRSASVARRHPDLDDVGDEDDEASYSEGEHEGEEVQTHEGDSSVSSGSYLDVSHSSLSTMPSDSSFSSDTTSDLSTRSLEPPSPPTPLPPRPTTPPPRPPPPPPPHPPPLSSSGADPCSARQEDDPTPPC
eukprot:TRINITY_DN2805_c0_g1_i2.p1 TRINITY_DN2805_c0_g1~~TRINITY_DN2805_c0_g1_i2.p1  ORF type:complete len:1572 (+),score=464.69 TRINITY_DN2805_c0_g1_i2:31-4716(+)